MARGMSTYRHCLIPMFVSDDSSNQPGIGWNRRHSPSLLCRVPEDCPQEVVDLINQCRHPEPAQRPSATDVVAILKRLQ